MSDIRQQYDEEFRKNVVKLSYASNKTVQEVARNLQPVYELDNVPCQVFVPAVT